MQYKLSMLGKTNLKEIHSSEYVLTAHLTLDTSLGFPEVQNQQGVYKQKDFKELAHGIVGAARSEI